MALSSQIIDSHCHLDFFDEERGAIIKRAEKAGIKNMLTIGTSLKTAKKIIKIAEENANIWCTIGIHPHESEKELSPENPKKLEILSNHPKVIGLGETGLDFYYNNSDKESQIRSFKHHIKVAKKTGLPIIVHSRSADKETANLLIEASNDERIRGLIHCFSASKELAESAIEIGFYISISGIVTFKDADALREVVQNIPNDRLLVETDAPYLAPDPMRGKKNEPSFITHTVDKIAALKGISSKEVAQITTNNFFKLFQKARAK